MHTIAHVLIQASAHTQSHLWKHTNRLPHFSPRFVWKRQSLRSTADSLATESRALLYVPCELKGETKCLEAPPGPSQWLNMGGEKGRRRVATELVSTGLRALSLEWQDTHTADHSLLLIVAGLMQGSEDDLQVLCDVVLCVQQQHRQQLCCLHPRPHHPVSDIVTDGRKHLGEVPEDQLSAAQARTAL